MGSDPRVDAFIAKAQPFAQPILSHLRDVIHRALPQVEEAIKWSRPAFVNEGRILGVLGAFKAHVSLHLWKAGEAGIRQPSPPCRPLIGCSIMPALLQGYIREAFPWIDGE